MCNGLDEMDRTMDVIKGYVEENDEVEGQKCRMHNLVFIIRFKLWETTVTAMW